MAKGYGHSRAKSTRGVMNTAKIGGSKRKLALKTDMKNEHLVHGDFKRASKSGPHKHV